MSNLTNISLETIPDSRIIDSNFDILNADKLEVVNIVQGENITLAVDGKNITISATQGAIGQDGVSLQYIWDGTLLGIKREDEVDYTYVNLKGQDGTNGKNIEIQSNGTYIQYKYVGDLNWINLVSLESLKGAKGEIGLTGERGLIGLTGNQGIQGLTGAQGAGLNITGVVASFATLPTTGVAVNNSFIANAEAKIYMVMTINPVTWSTGIDFKGINGSGAIYADTLPLVASRVSGVYYHKTYMDNGIKKVAWVEDYLGGKIDIHDYSTKLITMGVDGAFPTTVGANHFVKGLSIKGQTYMQEITNGNFASGTTNWSTSTGSISSSNNILKLINNGTSTFPNTSTAFPNFTNSNRKLYARAKVRITNSVCSSLAIATWNGTSLTTHTSKLLPIENEWYTLSTIINVTFGGSANLLILNNYSSGAVANTKVMEVKDAICLDLSKNPSLALLTADEINTRLPRYFEGMSSVGDVIDGKTYILCEVNGATQRVEIADKIRNNGTIFDEMINNILTRRLRADLVALATPTYETVDITTLSTTQGDNIIKYVGAVIPNSMTVTVSQTTQQFKTEQDTRITALENLALI